MIATRLWTTSSTPRLETSFTVVLARRSGQPISWPIPSPMAAPSAITMTTASSVGTLCSRSAM